MQPGLSSRHGPGSNTWTLTEDGAEPASRGRVACRRRDRLRVLRCLVLGAAVAAGATGLAEINPPLGPYVNLHPADFAESSSFTTNQSVVLTPYFYWYDVYSSAHILDADGSDALTDHPPTLTDFSYRSTAWHQTQLRDMMEAGIDVLLPVYWGEPSQRLRNQPVTAQPWSYSGIPPLVQARERLLSEGKKPPAIGMFYDTSTLQYNAANERVDLTTPHGKEWFYESIRDFFSLVPPKHWAMIDGHPIILLYSAAFALRHDQSCIDYVRTNFAREFGGRVPFIVREISWQVAADNVYAWGGALGLKNPGVASLGPGYDDSAVFGRKPLVVKREAGAFYERNWIRFLRRPAKLVVVETWNEYHEGTDVAASREYGRAYIDLTRKYVDLFRQGVRPPRPRGPYSDFSRVTTTLAKTNLAAGLEQFDSADGVTEPADKAGSACRATAPNPYGGRYLYFRIDDSFKWADPMLADIEIEYFDSAPGSFTVEFDGSDASAPFQGAYTACKLRVQLGGSNVWKKARFRASEAHFANSQNGGADFRVAVMADPFFVRRVTVIRPGVPAEAGQVVHGWQQDFAASLSPNWRAVGLAPSAFRQSNGLLTIQAAVGAPTYLALAIPEAQELPQEILARMRVAGFGGADFPLGGIAVGLQTNDSSALDFDLLTTSTGTRQTAWSGRGLPPGPRIDFAWQTNKWYWLRLRYETNALTNYPDLLARLWLADGESPEPDAWLSWWDYYPANPLRQGAPAIASGVNGSAQLEFDYFLLKSERLPEISVRLPPLKAARPQLTRWSFSSNGGFQLELQGEPEGCYFLESSTNLIDWSGPVLVADLNGEARFTDLGATSLNRRFYRAREATVSASVSSSYWADRAAAAFALAAIGHGDAADLNGSSPSPSPFPSPPGRGKASVCPADFGAPSVSPTLPPSLSVSSSARGATREPRRDVPVHRLSWTCLPLPWGEGRGEGEEDGGRSRSGAYKEQAALSSTSSFRASSFPALSVQAVMSANPGLAPFPGAP